MSKATLTPQLGFAGACFVLIGYVVGASIFVLPGELAGVAGPAVFIAYGIAAIPALLYSLVVAQTGALYPVSGGAFILVQENLSRCFGFIYLWVVLSMALVAIPLIALGFGQYAGLMIPGFSAQWLAILCIAVFTVTNCLGVSVAGTIQAALVVWFLLVLVLFLTAGISLGSTELLQPLLPLGVKGVFTAAATAYFSYAGVLVIAEIAGEIKQPGRNIPRIIAVGFLVVILLYCLVSLALAMTIPWRQLASAPAPVVAASRTYFPEPVVHGVLIGVLAAAATSVNSILLGLSRDLAAGALAGDFPRIFSRTSARGGAPVYAVCLLGGIAALGVGLGASITHYAQVAVVGLLVIQILNSLALWRLPRKQPQRLSASGFSLSPRVLGFACLGSVVIALVFMLLILSEDPRILLLVSLYLAIGLAYRHVWKRAAACGSTSAGEV